MLKLLNVYEDVSHVIKISDSVRFIDFVNLAVDDLRAVYGDSYVLSDDEYTAANEVKDDLNIHKEYHSALVSYVLSKLTGSDSYLSEYLSRADYAYRTVWRKLSRGMRKSSDVWY